MCGIAGYIGRRPLDAEADLRVRNAMHHRGPDGYGSSHHRFGEIYISLFSNRLAIVDPLARSNQPMKSERSVLVFNGEIYNYRELRKSLEAAGEVFATDSDTEVLLKQMDKFGVAGISALEGMWAFARLDLARGRLELCRDRFGEKPLLYLKRPEGIYFASEAATLEALSEWHCGTNWPQVERFLLAGHRALFSDPSGETFLNEMKRFPPAHCAQVLPEGLEPKPYWNLDCSVDPSLDFDESVELVRTILRETIRSKFNADVPVAATLSGGVDSGALVSYAGKVLNLEITSFSILDSDPRYNESKNIEQTVRDSGVKNIAVQLDTRGFLSRLLEMVRRRNAPVATISYYVQSMLMKEISKTPCKVVVAGTGVDEIFSGYYDHFLYHLAGLKASGSPAYEQELSNWQKYILPLVRNPVFQNPDLFVTRPDYREYNYRLGLGIEGVPLRSPHLVEEHRYCERPLRNRMLNELFREIVPVILWEDDLNAMEYSIENRSPYLDSRILSAAVRMPDELLIRDGFGKAVFREAVRGVLNDPVRLDRRKTGFNASISSVAPLSDRTFREWLLAPSKLFEIVSSDGLAQLLNKNSLSDLENRFLFTFISTKLFCSARSGDDVPMLD